MDDQYTDGDLVEYDAEAVDSTKQMRLPKIPEIYPMDIDEISDHFTQEENVTRQILSRQMELNLQWTAKEIFVLLMLLP